LPDRRARAAAVLVAPMAAIIGQETPSMCRRYRITAADVRGGE
jgi:hypothetical protein